MDNIGKIQSLVKQARNLNMDHHHPMPSLVQSSADTEATTFPQPNPRCRLCLQWANEEVADHGLQSMFTGEDDILPLKIRDCLGLIVAPEDSIQTICTNCRQTVSLIDEFRTMCRQTEEIYESVQIRCENREKWERYRECVYELRMLVQEHKDRINEQLVGVQEGVERTPDEDSIALHFVPMLMTKEESEEDCDDEPIPMEMLEIKPEPLPIDESDEATDENKEAKPSKGSDPDIYEQQVKIAQEVLKRLKLFTSNVVSPKQLWTEIAEKLGMEYSAIRTRWNRMKRRYLDNKAGAATGSQLMILRLEGCRLFNLMNQILPELDESVEPWVAPESYDTTDKRSSCKKLPIDIDLKIAIAEEIRSYPEIWNRSLVSSTVTMDQAWKTIARNFNMDDEYLRLHWRSLQDLYRRHKKREAEGAGVRTKADTKFYTLIEIMQDIYSVNEREIVKKEQMAEQTLVEEENEHQMDENAEEETETKVATPDGCPKMALAKLVNEYPHLWYQKHRDFYNIDARDATWDRIAKTLNKTREETKTAWKSLRNVYRLRVKRLKKGMLRPDARVLQDPLFKQLEVMFVQNKHSGPSDPLVATEPSAEAVSQIDESESGEDIGQSESPEEMTTICRDNVGPFPTMADKVRLVEEVSKHENIWKATHAHYYNIAARDASWDLIAGRLNKTREETKHGWKCMRKVFRTRMQRLKQGLLSPDARALKEPFFKQLELLFDQNTKNDPPVSSEASEPPPTEVAAASQMDASVSEEEHAGDTIESESDKNLKLVGLCEKYELIWNKKHPDNASVKKRMAAWDSIAQKMNLTRDQTRALWSRLFSLHRIRSSRISRGIMSKTSPVLRDPLYRKLEAMLKGQMQGDEGGEETGKIEPPEETMKPRRGKVGPFPRMEDKVRLVEEVFKHEHLWNATHVDYFKPEKRSATWTQIAAMFENCDAWGARNEWRRLRNKHRPRKTCAVSASTHDYDEEDEATVSNPLYELFSKMAESLIGENGGDPTENAESSSATHTRNDRKRRIQEITETYMTHKRRFTGKRTFNNEGCIKFIKGGITRYAKICELCGKQIERSLFEYHMNQHNGLKPYVCSVKGCGRKYGNKTRRDQHEVIDHCEDGYIFECDQCDEKFKYQSKFNYHYAVKHVSQQVPCTVCGKLFKHKRLLTEHLRRGAGCKRNVLRASLAS